MKTAILTALLVSAAFGAAYADDYVSGYTRRDGTQVQGYYRTSPDSNPYNNYSTRGNVNPYTGEPGYKSPYSQPNSNLNSGQSYSPYTPSSPYGR